MKDKITNIFKRPREEQISNRIIETDNMQENLLLHNALSFSANNTIEQMIKCKDAIQMNNLSITREKQSKLAYEIKFNQDNYISLDLSSVSVVEEALKEYKEKIIIDMKKSNCSAMDFECLCEEVYICNKLLKQIQNDNKIEAEIVEG